MKISSALLLIFLANFFSSQINAQAHAKDLDTGFLSWNEKNARSIGESWRQSGRVGGYFDLRVTNTDKSYNYKLRATLLSPEAIKAAARLEQLRSRLTDSQTLALIDDAEKEDLVIIIEVDPREGSGIIPNDWRAFIGSKNDPNLESIRGEKNPQLKESKALQSVSKRDYAYDIFWVSFSFRDETGRPRWTSVPNEIELVVGINEKEGKVTWNTSAELRQKIESKIKSK